MATTTAPVSAHPWTPECPSVEIPARQMVPGVLVQAHGPAWLPVTFVRHRIESDGANWTAVTVFRPWPTRDRGTVSDLDFPWVVHVPDVSQLPDESPELVALDARLVDRDGPVVLTDTEEHAAVQWLKAAPYISPGVLVGDRTAPPWCRGTDDFDVVFEYVFSRRKAALDRRIAAGEFPPHILTD